MTDHKDLYRRYIDALMIKDGEALDRALDQVLAVDFVAHDLPGGLVDGRGALKAFRRQVHVGFPDQTLTIEDLIAEDDRVAARLTAVGTHLGEFRGIPATGLKITVEIFDIIRAGRAVPARQMVRRVTAAMPGGRCPTRSRCMLLGTRR